MKAKLIKAGSDELIEIEPKDGRYFSLEEMQGYVGGYIEVLTPEGISGARLVVNEEGKLIGLPVNTLATAIWQEFADPGSQRMGDPVVGDVILCHDSQLER